MSSSLAPSDSRAAVCTVVTRSHLPYARALMHSVARFHPEVDRFVLVVDSDPEPQVEEAFQTVLLASLSGIDPEGFLFQYSAFEACNALKSFLIRHLRKDQGFRRILYLDSDTLLYSRISSVFDALDTCGVLLTPHSSREYSPADRDHDSDQLLYTGVFNAGVVGVGALESSVEFIDWWCSKLQFGCVVHLSRGIFVDQKYLDLVPAFFKEVCICSDPSVNVGHFNFHGRKITRRDGQWLLGGEPLKLFHFTQFNPLETSFNLGIRSDEIDSYGDFRAFLGEYRSILERFGFPSSVEYRFNRHESGVPITKSLREHHRTLAKAGIAPSRPFSDPHYEVRLRKEHRKEANARWFRRVLRPVRWVLGSVRRLFHPGKPPS